MNTEQTSENIFTYINIVNRLIIIQMKVLRIMDFKDQLFRSSPLFSENRILKFGDKITLENINISIGK